MSQSPVSSAILQERNSSYWNTSGSSLLPRSARHPDIPSPPSYGIMMENTAKSTRDLTPPATPSHRLLDPSDANAQFASYHVDEPWNVPELMVIQDENSARGWTPVPLRPVFWIPLVSFMVSLAIALEIALHFSNTNQGWSTNGAVSSDSGFMHFVYTLPPVIVAMIIVALLTWTDIEIKKMQPYIDLLYGDSPPHRSLLLDYTRENNFVVWISAALNKHFLVAVATLVALVALVFQPLGAAMFTVRDTWWGHPLTNVTNLGAIGLNQNTAFQDLTSFLSAAGYASSSVLYDLGDPSFIHDVYTIAPFQIPTNVATNGTVFANTTAVKSEANCQLAKTVSTLVSPGSWTNTAIFNGCTFSFSVNNSTVNLFGADVMPDCNNTGTPDWFRPIILWFFTYESTPAQGSATYCAPTISLWDVAVSVDIATSNLTSVTEIGPFNASTSPFASLSGNVTGPPLNGLAYNGVGFNLTTADPFVLARANATDLQLPASILQAAETSPGGVLAAFGGNGFTGMATQVYTTYLKLIAKSVYFLPTTQNSIVVRVRSVKKRLWLSDVAVHLEVAALFVLALVTTVVQLLHQQNRKELRLRHEPGTIASAVSIGAQTSLANLLHGQQERDDIIQALQNRKFRIDPRTMKILMEGESGYEQATSPNPRRSIFGVLGLRPGDNKQFSNFGLKSR